MPKTREQEESVLARTASQEAVLKLMRRFVSGPGIHPSNVPGVRFTHLTQHQPRSPAIYEPSIIIVGEGRRQGYFGDCRYTYDAGHYLVLSVPILGECEVFATPEHPATSMTIDVDLAMLGELLLDYGDYAPNISAELPRGICATKIRPKMYDAVTRLLECLQCPVDSRVLGRQIVREIIFHVLREEQGAALRAVAMRDSHFGQISKLLRRINQAYAQPMEVEVLAKETGLSPSAFHRKFKAVTFLSPIQYIKLTRLHKARTLMAFDSFNVGMAASEVGYESASQFSREFKRTFGRTPADEAARLRSMPNPSNA